MWRRDYFLRKNSAPFRNTLQRSLLSIKFRLFIFLTFLVTILLHIGISQTKKVWSSLDRSYSENRVYFTLWTFDLNLFPRNSLTPVTLDQSALRIDSTPEFSMQFCCWGCCTLSNRAPSPQKYQIILIVMGKKGKKVLLTINVQFCTERAEERKVRGRCMQFSLGAKDCHKAPTCIHREEIYLIGCSKIHKLTQGTVTLARVTCLQFKAANIHSIVPGVLAQNFQPCFPKHWTL